MGFGLTGPRIGAQNTTNSPNVSAEQVDRRAFPLLYEYLSKLPDGLKSYAQCQVISDFASRLQHDHPTIWTDSSLPLPLRNRLQEVWKPGQFVSTVLVACQSMVLRDRLRMGEDEYLNATAPLSWSILNSPLYRAALYVMSPNLLLLNLSKRWGRFVQGTELISMEGSKSAHQLKLVAPAHLYPTSWLRFYAKTFEGALAAARATDIDVRMVRMSDTETFFHLKWTR